MVPLNYIFSGSYSAITNSPCVNLLHILAAVLLNLVITYLSLSLMYAITVLTARHCSQPPVLTNSGD